MAIPWIPSDSGKKGAGTVSAAKTPPVKKIVPAGNAGSAGITRQATIDEKIENREAVAQEQFQSNRPWRAIKFLIDGYDKQNDVHVDGAVELYRRRGNESDFIKAYKILYKIIYLASKDNDFINRIRGIYGFRKTDAEINAYTQGNYVSTQYFQVNAAQAMIAIAELVCKQLNDNQNPKIIPLNAQMEGSSPLEIAISYCEEARKILLSTDKNTDPKDVIPDEQKDYFHVNQSRLVQAQLEELRTVNKVSDKDLRDLMADPNIKDQNDLNEIAQYYHPIFWSNIYLTQDPFKDPEVRSEKSVGNAVRGMKYLSIAFEVENIKLASLTEHISKEEIDTAINKCKAAENKLVNLQKTDDYVYHSAVITRANLLAKRARLADDRKGLETAKGLYETEIKAAYSSKGFKRGEVPYKDIIALGEFGKISLELELGQLNPQDINDYLKKYFTNDQQNLKWLFAQGSYSFNSVADLQMKLERIVNKAGTAAAATSVQSYTDELEAMLQSIGNERGRNPRAKLEQAAQTRIDYAGKIALDVKYNKTNDRIGALKYAKEQFQAALHDLDETEETIKNDAGSRKSDDIFYIAFWSDWASCLQQIAVLENKEKENIAQFQNVSDVFDQALDFCEDYEKKNNVSLKERKDLIQLSHAYALNEQGGYLASIGDLDGAMAKYQASLDKIAPKLTTPEAQMARSQVRLSISYIQLTLGRYNDALDSVTAGMAAIPAPTSSAPDAPIDFNTTRTGKAQNVSLYNAKELELKLLEVQLIARLNSGEYTYKIGKTGQEKTYYYEDYIDKLNRELADAEKVDDNYNTGDKTPFILLLHTLLIKARLGFGDILALQGENKKAQEQYEQVVAVYNNIKRTWEKPLTASNFLLQDQAGVLQALPEAQANVISAYTRIADYLRSLNSKEWEAGKINKSRVKYEKEMYGLAGTVVSGDPENDPIFINLFQYFKPVNGELTVQEKNRAFAEVDLARADAKSRLPEARENDYKDVSADIDNAEKLCNEAINKGYQKDLALNIVLADACLARANILCQRKIQNNIKISDPALVELYRVKEALGVKNGKPEDPHTIEYAISMLEGFKQKNANNLQVNLKLAQAYEAKGQILLNQVAAVQNLEKAQKSFEDAQTIYSNMPRKDVKNLGLARIYKSLGDIRGAQGKCVIEENSKGEKEKGAKEYYEDALTLLNLNNLNNVSDSDETKRLRAELYFALGGTLASLWQGEEIRDKGESPDSLIARCPAALANFKKALELLGVSSGDVSDLSKVTEEKALFASRILLRMEMTKTIGNSGYYSGALSELDKLQKWVIPFKTVFLLPAAVSMLSREIDLNMGRIYLWMEKCVEARKIFGHVLQDRNGIDLAAALAADKKTKIETEASRILKDFPDEGNFAAAVHLAESYRWKESERDLDLSDYLLNLVYSNGYCPLYLRNEAVRELNAKYGAQPAFEISYSNKGKLDDRSIGIKDFSLWGLSFYARAGAGNMNYTREYDAYGQAVTARDSYHHFDLGVSKWLDDGTDRTFMSLDFSKNSLPPKGLSSRAIKFSAGYGQKLSEKFSLFGRWQSAVLSIKDPKKFLETIGRGNETENPVNIEEQAGLQYTNSWLKASASYIHDEWGWDELTCGMGYPPMKSSNAVSLTGELNTDKWRLAGEYRLPLGANMFQSSASASLTRDFKNFAVTASVANYVTDLHRKSTVFGLNMDIKLRSSKKISGGNDAGGTGKVPDQILLRSDAPKPSQPPVQQDPAKPLKPQAPTKPENNGQVRTVRSGDTIPRILMNELKAIKSGRGDMSQVTKKEWDQFIQQFIRLNVDEDGLLNSYTVAQKNWVGKHQVAGGPLSWVFAGQKLILPNGLLEGKKQELKPQNNGNDRIAKYKENKIKTEKPVPRIVQAPPKNNIKRDIPARVAKKDDKSQLRNKLALLSNSRSNG